MRIFGREYHWLEGIFVGPLYLLIVAGAAVGWAIAGALFCIAWTFVHAGAGLSAGSAWLRRKIPCRFVRPRS